MIYREFYFRSAKPVYEAGCDRELNHAIKLEEDICGYFDYMANLTGTLWEHKDIKASCNHGFASHVLVWLDKLGYIKCKSDF